MILNQLRKIVRNNNNTDPAGGKVAQNAVDLCLCAYINTNCRPIQNKKLGVRIQPLGYDNLLSISA